MNVWKKQTVKYFLGNHAVPKGTPKAKRKRILSRRFYGTLKLFTGKTKQVPLTEDRETSQTLLRRLQTEEDFKRANGADRYYEERRRPLGDLLGEYEVYLCAKANTPKHVALQVERIRKLLTATKAKSIDDLEARRIVAVLSRWRTVGVVNKRKGRKAEPIGIGTTNHYLVAIKGFSRWLWQERKSPDDPLAGLRRLNSETDRKRIRRPLALNEIGTLIASTIASRKTYRGNDWRLTATNRAMLYRLASYTGLRASELASLTKSSFDLQAGTFTLEAANTKNRKRVTLPLHPKLITTLQDWLPTVKGDVLFPGSWARRFMGGKILKRDLKGAGIPYRDEMGRFVDFHALRYTFITSLAKAGVHPSKAQRLARHSTVALTLNVYTSLEIDDLREAVDSLPAIG